MIKPDNNPVYIVTALQSEANPLIEHYKLKSVRSRPFREFASDSVRLIVSGMGKINTAAATAALLHNEDNIDRAICVNIGIAGHGSLPLGETFVAHRVSDTISGSDWYPQMTFNPACPSSQLHTVESPSSDYPKNAGLDMEASAFYPLAIRYITAELCQILKVVSDTPDHAIDNLDKHTVSELICNAMPAITSSIESLKRLSSHQYDGSHIRQLASRYKEIWHLTVSQELRLLRLLERHEALFQTIPEPGIFGQAVNTKDMIKQLEQIVSERGLELS